MRWKERELVTLEDLMTHGIEACATKEEAREFMRLLRKEQPHLAAKNIGYLSGYYDRKTQLRIFDWFEVAHPVFGTYAPTPEEALAAGMAQGRELAKERDP